MPCKPRWSRDGPISREGTNEEKISVGRACGSGANSRPPCRDEKYIIRKLELPTEIRMVSISHTYYSIASVSFKSYITSHHLRFEGIDEFSGVECVKMYVQYVELTRASYRCMSLPARWKGNSHVKRQRGREKGVGEGAGEEVRSRSVSWGA